MVEIGVACEGCYPVMDSNMPPRVMTLEVLACLEETVMALSAPYLTVADVQEARQINEAIAYCTSVGDIDRYGALAHDIHELLYSRCPNKHLLELVRWEAAEVRAQSIEHPIYSLDAAIEAVWEHNVLLDLIETRTVSREVRCYSRAHRMRTVRTVEAGLTDVPRTHDTRQVPRAGTDR